MGLSLAVDGLQRPVDDGQRAQAEEVELNQADGLDIVLVELGDQIVAAGLAVKRTKIGEIGRGNHHAPGMLAGITGQPLQRTGQIDEGAYLLVALIEILEVLAVLQSLFEGDAQLKRNQLGDPVDEAIGVAQHAPDVPHHRLGGHAAVGDDLRHAVAPVGCGDVVDDLVAAIHAEVDIEVGHGHALGIEEALEQQLELDRIEIGDFQGIGHQRARARATARADRDAMLLGPLDEVGDDQEVAGEIHLVDDPDFQFQPGAVSGGAFFERARADGGTDGQTFLKPAPAFLGKILAGGQARRHRKIRQEILAEGERQIAALGNLDRIFQGLRQIGEQGRHCLGALQILLIGIVPGPPRVIQNPALMDADPGLMGIEVAGVKETNVVGGDYWRVQSQGEFNRGGNERLFLRAPGALHLQVEAVTENTQPVVGETPGLLGIGGQQRPADLTLSGAGQCNKTAVVIFQPVGQHLRYALMLILPVGPGDQLAEGLVALGVLDEQGHRERRGRFGFVGDQHVGAADRLDAR